MSCLWFSKSYLKQQKPIPIISYEIKKKIYTSFLFSNLIFISNVCLIKPTYYNIL